MIRRKGGYRHGEYSTSHRVRQLGRGGSPRWPSKPSCAPKLGVPRGVRSTRHADPPTRTCTHALCCWICHALLACCCMLLDDLLFTAEQLVNRRDRVSTRRFPACGVAWPDPFPSDRPYPYVRVCAAGISGSPDDGWLRGSCVPTLRARQLAATAHRPTCR